MLLVLLAVGSFDDIGVNSYLNVWFGGLPVYENICCTCSFTSPEVAASAVGPKRLVSAVISNISDSTMLTIDLLCSVCFLFDVVVAWFFIKSAPWIIDGWSIT